MSNPETPGDNTPEGADLPRPASLDPHIADPETVAPPDSISSQPSTQRPPLTGSFDDPFGADEPTAKTELPPVERSFDDLGLPPSLRAAVRDLGWEKPTAVQSATFEVIAAGKDVLVQSQTGTGKTGAFCLPWLAKRFVDAHPSQTGVQLIALTPTRELAKQVCDELLRLSKDTEVVPLPVYGGTAMQPQLAALKAGVHAVVGTPGRVLDHIRRRSLDLSRVKMVVLDEADEMLSMGFLEDIHSILDACTSDERQTTLFSATVPSEIERIARRYMKTPVSLRLSGDDIAAAEILHTYYSVTSAVKTRDLLDVIAVEEPVTALVFCNTREEVGVVSSVLQREGFSAEPLSSDLTQTARERVLGWMRQGKLRFLVATDVASRGIDISHISHVINYSFPENAESYVHRTGRTGRAGRAGQAISLLSPQEIGHHYYLKLQYPSITFEERHLPPAEELTAQRTEVKLDQVSKLFPELVSPEWTLLARNLMKDPRGERVIAYLLSQAMSTRPRKLSMLEEELGDDARLDTERPREGGWSDGRGRGRDRGPRGRDRDRGGGRDDRPRIDGRTDERPRIDGRTDDRPRIDGRTDDRPRIDGRTDERPRIDGRTDDRPRIDGRTDERPRIDGRTDERPRIDGRSDERPRTDDRPRIDGRTDDRPRGEGRRDERPRGEGRWGRDRGDRGEGRRDERPRSEAPEGGEVREIRDVVAPAIGAGEASEGAHETDATEGVATERHEGSREGSGEGSREGGRGRRRGRGRGRDRDRDAPRDGDRPRDDREPRPFAATGSVPAPHGEAATGAGEEVALALSEDAVDDLFAEPRETVVDENGAPINATGEPEDGASIRGESDGESGGEPGEGGRRRRRRRRRRRGGGQPDANVATAAAHPDASRTEGSADEGDDDGDDDAPQADGSSETSAQGADDEGNKRRRRRRRGRRRGGDRSDAPVQAAAHEKVVAPEAPIPQDEIVIDIDENELEIVRDAFGEIDELDDFTLKGRRRGVLDTLAEEVELEDLTARDQAPAPGAEDSATDGEIDGDGDSDSDGDDDGDGEGAGESLTNGTVDADSDDPNKRKRKRRRRRKKKADEPPPPALMAPPHKDFWEVWATHFSYTDFEEANPEPEPEPEPLPQPARTRERSDRGGDRGGDRGRDRGRDRDRDRDRPAPRDRPIAETAFDDTAVVDTDDLVTVRLNLGRSHDKKAANIRDLLAEKAGVAGRRVKNLTVGDRDTEFQIGRALYETLGRTLEGTTCDGVVLSIMLLEVAAPEPSADDSADDLARDTTATEDPIVHADEPSDTAPVT